MKATWFQLPESGVERRLSRTEAPALVRWGAEDRFVAPLHGRIFAQGIPRARLETIPAAGHPLAGETAAALSRFLAA